MCENVRKSQEVCRTRARNMWNEVNYSFAVYLIVRKKDRIVREIMHAHYGVVPRSRAIATPMPFVWQFRQLFAVNGRVRRVTSINVVPGDRERVSAERAADCRGRR